MSTITQTVTETITLILRLPPAARAPERSPGHVLDSNPRVATPRPIPLEWEHNVRSRIDALVARNCAAKFDLLIQQMRKGNFLSEEAGIELENCSEVFFKSDPHDREGRSLTLGLLLLKVIRPSLLQGVSLKERDQLHVWEKECREILQLTLPEGEAVATFLEECEVGIREERLMYASCARADAAAEAQMEAISLIAQKVRAQGEEAYASMNQHVSAVQNARKKMHHMMDAEMEEIQKRMDQLGAQVAMQGAGIALLGARGLSNPGLESDLLAAKVDLIKLL